MSEYVTTLGDGTRVASCKVDTLPLNPVVEVATDGEVYYLALGRDMKDGEDLEKSRAAIINEVDGRRYTAFRLSSEAMMAIVLMYAELQKEGTT